MGGAYRSGDAGMLSTASAMPHAAGVSRIEFRSHDQDETREYLRNNYAEHSRVVHGKGRFLHWFSATDTGRVILGRGGRWLRQTLRAAVPHPTLFLSLQPGEVQSYGRKRYELRPDLALFSAAGHEYTRTGGSIDTLFLRVESGLLEREIDARVGGRSRRWLAPSAPIAMTAVRRAELLAFDAQPRANDGPGEPWGPYGDREAFERVVAGWMADLILGASGVRSANDLSLERVVRVQRWIDAHLDQDITLDRLCAVAGIGPRALQRSLLAARGQSPHEFVTSRRLAVTRRLLESGSSRVVVSKVALDCGFSHLGRFAAAYRRAYGESPSETASRRRPSDRAG